MTKSKERGAERGAGATVRRKADAAIKEISLSGTAHKYRPAAIEPPWAAWAALVKMQYLDDDDALVFGQSAGDLVAEFLAAAHDWPGPIARKYRFEFKRLVEARTPDAEQKDLA
jgi:hypothetical protein